MIKKIYNLDPKKEWGELVWQKNWLSPYESPWSLFEKFMYANSATIKDIFYLFGNDYVNRLKSKNFSKTIRNIITLEALDGTQLFSVLGADIKNINARWVESILRIVPREYRSNYFREGVAFCPECMEEGYHSLFHQLKCYDHCVFHKVSLIFSCPGCNKTIPYELTDKWSKGPFTCECGYKLCLSDSPKDIFSLWSKHPKIKLPESIGNIIRHQKNKLDLIKNTLTFNAFFNDHQDKKILDHLYQIIEPKYKRFDSYNYIKISSAKHIFMLKNSWEPGSKEEFFTDLYISTRQTFKAIARYIRKTYKNQHKKCIRKIVISLGEDGEDLSCPYAYTYVMWRRSLNGLSHYKQVDNGRQTGTTIPIRNILDFMNSATYFDYKLINELFIEINNRCDDISLVNISVMKWLFNRVLAFTILEKFKYYYKKQQSTAIIHPVQETGAKIPFFICIFPHIEKGPLEFHYWLPK